MLTQDSLNEPIFMSSHNMPIRPEGHLLRCNLVVCNYTLIFVESQAKDKAQKSQQKVRNTIQVSLLGRSSFPKFKVGSVKENVQIFEYILMI